MKKRIACIIGTRPEVIKMAPVIQALSNSSKLTPIILSTGQHKELLAQALSIFSLTSAKDLQIMQENQAVGPTLGTAIAKLSGIFAKKKYDAILVQGDTVTAFAGAVSSFLSHIPVGHVEAGLRTYDHTQPWPEEATRQMLDRLPEWYFAPTDISRHNLESEHIPKNKIYVTGNTVIDAVLSVEKKLSKSAITLRNLGLPADEDFILMTGHRRENHGSAFLMVAQALKQIAVSHPELRIIYPVHPNPNVKEPMHKSLGRHKNIHLVDPLDYLDFLSLMRDCKMIISDSGGVQEEASVFHKSVVLLRETTERPEGVSAGMTHVTGCNHEKIVSTVESLLKSLPTEKRSMPYGDGQAAKKIVNILESTL